MIASKKKGAVIKKHFIKDNLFLFLRATVPNPTFDSQSKDTLTTPANKFGVKIELPGKFVERIYQLGDLVDRVSSLSVASMTKDLKKSDGTKRATVSGIPKLDDAEWAGTQKSSQCTLILTEGDSAKAMAIAGLVVVGRQKFGVFPLRGKMLNVCDATVQKISENAEIASLKKILGLQSGRDYETVAELRYGSVMILADADADGSHIKGLVMNLFANQWPSLLRIPGFICSMLTPIVKAHTTRGKKTKNVKISDNSKGSCDTDKEFYSMSAFQEWSSGLSEEEMKQWTCKYYKGLGTSTPLEAREYFKVMRLISYEWSNACQEAMDLAFNKKRANDRKQWLTDYNATSVASTDTGTLSYQEFIDKDLIHFSAYDTERSIPNLVDGLKISQRKVLFGCFKRDLTKEIKVLQLAGYISEHAVYHHGDTSLHGTIVGMAQDFVGSNNINLLEPVGQFGTRLTGGGDSASPRYIHTHMTSTTRKIYCPEDDDILTYLQVEGIPVEPQWYLPIIPMVLVNGAVGIGTGYSTSIPCYNPRQIISRLVSKIKAMYAADEVSESDGDCIISAPLVPWYRGYTGPSPCHGVYKQIGKTSKVRITELPIGVWTDDFKVTLEAFVTRNADVKSFSNDSGDTTVDFTVTFQNAAITADYLEKDDNGFSRLDKELKLVNNRCTSTSNMHLFDSSGRIKRYATPEAIIDEFVTVRLEGYAKRKKSQMEILSHRVLLLHERIHFLDLVTTGKLQLHTVSDTDFDSVMKSHELAMIDNSYSYLTSMPMSSMTRSKKENLEKSFKETEASLKLLESTGVMEMWQADLSRLDAALDKMGYPDNLL